MGAPVRSKHVRLERSQKPRALPVASKTGIAAPSGLFPPSGSLMGHNPAHVALVVVSKQVSTPPASVDIGTMMSLPTTTTAGLGKEPTLSFPAPKFME